MIARVWHGFAPIPNAGRHVAYLQRELLPRYLGAPGNRGALLLARSEIDCAEFLVVSIRRHIRDMGRTVRHAIVPIPQQQPQETCLKPRIV
jgi:hypothetical protein